MPLNFPPSRFAPGVVQVAGVHDVAEARLLDDLGVDLIGLPLRLPVHRPDVTEARAAELIAQAGIGSKAVLITYETDPAEVVALARQLGVGIVQLHGDIPVAACGRITALAPELLLIKSLVLGTGVEPLAQLRAYAPAVRMFLSDTFDPATGASGATGKTHDWAVSRALATEALALGRPFLLAGGLHPGNVAEAIRAVRPFGVDAHTGLEGPDGRKDPRLVRQFVERTKKEYSAG